MSASAHSRAISRLLAKLESLGYSSYEEYLRSDHWRDVKRAYGCSDRSQYCPCGAWGTDLHHRTYRRLGEERLGDLVPLCREHHRELHHRARAASWPGMHLLTCVFVKEIAA